MKKYSEEERNAMSKLFGLSDEQIDIVEEADNLGDSAPQGVIDSNDLLAKAFTLRVEAWLKEKGLWDEVGQTLELAHQGLTRGVTHARRPFGSCLAVALGLLS